jgi:ABC-2 type transport system ATP-binding protein
MLNAKSDHPLQIQELVKLYPGGAGVSDVSLTVPKGAITGFIGANGAGKSTTLRCILGLAEPDAGELLLFGAPASFEARQRVGFLPEERGLSPHDRVRDVIAFHGRLKGMARARAYARADELLEGIGLGGRRRARVGELSKGNAQRVQILCALVHDPELLILDEPLSGLDPIGQAEILSLFAEHRSRGGSILFSTHSIPAAEGLCDRVVMLARGRTVFEGSVADAAGHAPHGATVVTPDEERLLAAVRSLGGEARPLASRIGEGVRWRIVLPRHVPHPALMRALAENQTPIYSFEPIKADLEGAFWSLAEPAGAAAAEPLRAAA